MKKHYPENRKRSEGVMVMLTKEEKESIQRYTFEKGLTVGAWFRMLAFKKINGGDNQ